MTPAELFLAVQIIQARQLDIVETLKRIESQNQVIIRKMNQQETSHRNRVAAYSHLRKKYERVLAQQTVKSELTTLLREFVSPPPEPPTLPAKKKSTINYKQK